MKLEDVEEYGLTAQGKRELIKYLEGGKLTRKEAMLARCFECMNGYADGRIDCQVESCPLYPYMPYSACKITCGSNLTPEQRLAIGQRLKTAKEKARRCNNRLS